MSEHKDTHLVAARRDGANESAQKIWGRGRYLVHEKIGQGGMGVVYRATDQHRKSLVALKTVPAGDGAALSRLKQEFRVLADVAHPNLVDVHELNGDDEPWFFAMEFVDGRTLDAYVCDSAHEANKALNTRGWATYEASFEESHPAVSRPHATIRQGYSTQLEPRRHESPTTAKTHPTTLEGEATAEKPRVRCYPRALLDALPPLVDALNALHAAGLLHRDVKPGNVMVARDGRPVLLDFGITSHLDDESGSLAGTPPYMAPEVLMQERLEPAADWYAFGATLYHLLTGKTPGDFRREPMVPNLEPLPFPSDLCDGVPPVFDRLCERLLEPAPVRRAGYQEVCRIMGISPRVARGAMQASKQFAGRATQIAQLESAAQRARGGRLTVALVRGRSGMGKSAAVNHFLKRDGASAHPFVLRGRCYANETGAYKGFDALVTNLVDTVRRLPERTRKEVLPAAPESIACLFPAATRFTNRRALAAVERLDPRVVRQRAIDKLCEVFANLGKLGPTICYLDDLQWADLDTIDILTAMVERASEIPVLFILTYREEEVEQSAALRQFLTSHSPESQSIGTIHQISIGPLSRAEADAVIDAMPESSVLTDALRAPLLAEANGNPFFLRELVYHAAERRGSLTSSASLDSLIRTRTNALGEDAREVLETLAVAATPQSTARVGVSAVDCRDVGRALHELRIQRLASAGYIGAVEQAQCYHDRIRETVVNMLSQDRLREIHGRIADAMQREDASEYQALHEHLVRAGRDAEASHYAERAAGKAVAQLAFDRAVELYERALDGCDEADTDRRDKLVAELARALVHAGRNADAADRYEALAERSSEQDTQDYLRLASQYRLASGDVPAGLALLGRAMDRVKESVPRTMREALLRLLWLRVRISVRGYGFSFRPAAEVAPVKLAAIDACWSAAVSLAWMDNFRSAYFQSRCLLLSLKAGEPTRVARSVFLEAGFIAVGGHKSQRRALRALESAERLTQTARTPYLELFNHMSRANYEFQATLNFPACLKHAKQGYALLAEYPELTYERISTANYLMWMMYYLGFPKELRHYANEVRRDADARGDRYALHGVIGGLPSFHHIAFDEPASALRGSRAILDAWDDDGPTQLQHYFGTFGAAQALLYMRRPEEAHRVVMKHWAKLKKAMLLRIEMIASPFGHLRFRTAVAAAIETGAPEYVKDARTMVRFVTKYRGGVKEVMGHMTAGSWYSCTGDTERACAEFLLAERKGAEGELHLFENASRFARGSLLAGDEGSALRARATSELAERGYAKPEKIAFLFAPFRSAEEPQHAGPT